MGKTLVIVESPGKVHKIQEILGKNYYVMASKGHIIDLEKKSLSVDPENKFKPKYTVITDDKNKFNDKRSIVAELVKKYEDATDVLLATDEDREGEMIAWSIAFVLKLKEPKRITFNSITKNEILKAVKNPRKIDYNLVDAQKGRRILDRIVGYEISPILWNSIKAKSAGRVQSVVVKIIQDRENEIKDFFQKESSSHFKFDAEFLDADGNSFKASLFDVKGEETDDEDNKSVKSKKSTTLKTKKLEDIDITDEIETKDEKCKQKGTIRKGTKAYIKTKAETKDMMKLMSKSSFKIAGIGQKESLRYPSPPFTTSTMQQEASRKLGMAIKRTTQAAQNLYEAGYITYMRTDSVNLSNEALKTIGKFIVDEYGKDYHREMNYKTKTKNTQEAHEAIRPTDVTVIDIEPTNKIGSDEIRLYRLIWKRAVASQMTPAKFDVMTIQIDISKLQNYYFVTRIENLLFSGFLKTYDFIVENNGEDANSNIKIPKVGTKIDNKNIIATEEYQKPPVRYNEASLVNKLDPKNLNIGRPSTYPTIISTILNREYVKFDNIDGIEKDSVILRYDTDNNDIEEEVTKILLGKETNKMVPTPLGTVLVDFLTKHFPKIMDYKFTANMENDLDRVAEGKNIWHKVLDNFYKDFHPTVVDLLKNLPAQENNYFDKDTRVLGIHPESGAEIIATSTRYDNVVKMLVDEKKGKYAYRKIVSPLKIDTITLDDAVKLLSFPKDLGNYNKKDVYICKGRYGTYIKWGDMNVTVDDKFDPDNCELEQATEYIDEYIQKQNEKYLWSGRDGKIDYKIMNGDYGRYISVRDTASKTKKKPLFIKLSEDVDLNKLTIAEVKKLVSDGKIAKASYKAKKTAGKTMNKTDNEKLEIIPVKKVKAPVKKTKSGSTPSMDKTFAKRFDNPKPTKSKTGGKK